MSLVEKGSYIFFEFRADFNISLVQKWLSTTLGYAAGNLPGYPCVFTGMAYKDEPVHDKPNSVLSYTNHHKHDYNRFTQSKIV